MKLTQIPHAAALVEAARTTEKYADSGPEWTRVHTTDYCALLRALSRFDAAAEDPDAVVETEIGRRASSEYRNGGTYRSIARAALAAIPGVEV